MLSKTQQNLTAAFAGESQASQKYLAFSKQAEVEKLPSSQFISRRCEAEQTMRILTCVHEHIKTTAENLKLP